MVKKARYRGYTCDCHTWEAGAGLWNSRPAWATYQNLILKQKHNLNPNSKPKKAYVVYLVIIKLHLKNKIVLPWETGVAHVTVSYTPWQILFQALRHNQLQHRSWCQEALCHVGLTEKAAQGCRSGRGARAGFSVGQEGRARYLAGETSEQGKRPSSPSHQEAGLGMDS